MSKLKKAIIGLCAVCVLLAALLGYTWHEMKERQNYYSRQHSGLNNAIPFCMKVANAYVNGDTEQMVQLSRAKDAAEFPGLDAYKDLDLAFDGLNFPVAYLGGEGIYPCVIRYRLLSQVPSALAEVIPPERIEHRDGKDYVYQRVDVFYEYDKLEEENLGWSYGTADFEGEPFSGVGDEATLRHYGNR